MEGLGAVRPFALIQVEETGAEQVKDLWRRIAGHINTFLTAASPKTCDISSLWTCTVKYQLEHSLTTAEGMMSDLWSRKMEFLHGNPKQLGQPLTIPLRIKRKCLLPEMLVRR